MRNVISSGREFARSDFARHGFLVFLSGSLINVLGYVYHFAISRRVGVEQYGVLSALNAGFMLSVVIGGIASTVVVKYAAEFRATDDRAHLAALVRRLTLYGGSAMVVLVAAGVVAARSIAAFLKIDNVHAVLLTILVAGFSVVTPPLRAVFVGIEDFRSFSLAVVLESLLKALFGIGLVYAGYGVVGAFSGWAAGSFIALVFTVLVLHKRFRRVPGAPLYVDFRRLLKTMANVSLATILLTSISYADVVIVKHYADPTTAGLYGALSLSGKILLFVVGFVPTIVLPKASRRALGGHSPVGVLLQAVVVSVAISGTGLVVYYAFPAFIITTLAGASFAPAAPYVFSYGLAMVLLAALSVVVSYKIGIHRFDFILPLAVCALGELAGISLQHRSLSQIIAVLIAGNGVALAGAAWRVNAPLASPGKLQRSDAAA